MTSQSSYVNYSDLEYELSHLQPHQQDVPDSYDARDGLLRIVEPPSDDATDKGYSHETNYESPKRRQTSRFNPFVRRTYSKIAHGHEQPKFGPHSQEEVKVRWKVGVRWVTAAALLIMLINVGITIFAAYKFGMLNGISTLYVGNCSSVSWMDSGVHVAINVLSSGFLAASNYVMQILNAPTRATLDRYHAKRQSLFIGVPSFRNAWRVGWRQSFLWALLLLSAVPLHLLWNSAVFTTLQANQFDIFIVSRNFNTTSFSCTINDECGRARLLYDLAKTPNGLEYLDTASCIQKYNSDFLSGRQNLLLVTNSTELLSLNGSHVLGSGTVFGRMNSLAWEGGLNNNNKWSPSQWWCEGSWVYAQLIVKTSDEWRKLVEGCVLQKAMVNAAKLEYQIYVEEYSQKLSVDHCLSQVVPESCQLGFAVYIMIIVIACNAIKVISMACALWTLGNTPLVTIGDAVSSFLETPDPSTKGHCLAQNRKSFISQTINGDRWHYTRKFWCQAPSAFAMIRLYLLSLVALSTTGVLLKMGLDTTGRTTAFSGLSFGGVNAAAILQNFAFSKIAPNSFEALAWPVLVANSPQLVFSILYFMYNSVLTSMLSMDEWNRFAYRRATLRVSYPIRGQRATYWLQLPYKYGIPLLIASSVMHWLISQSIFLARVWIYDHDGKPYPANAPSNTLNLPLVSTLGYSPVAIIASMSLGGAMLLSLLGIGFRRYKGGIPVVHNESLAISAACHAPQEDHDPAHSKLMWGAVSDGDQDSPGHCCFTSLPVSPPKEGQFYAG